MSVPVTSLNFSYQDDAESCSKFLRIFQGNNTTEIIKEIRAECGRLVITYKDDVEDLYRIEAAAKGFFNACELFRWRF